MNNSMKKRSQKSLYEAVLKVKEELMLLGFISFLLSVFQGAISKICIPKSFLHHMLPCRRKDYTIPEETTSHFQVMGAVMRHLLAETESKNHCEKKGKEQLLSIEAIHQLHIFIFVLAITHVVLSVVTICLGGLKIRQWKIWEDSIAKNYYNAENSNPESKVTHVQHHDFIKEHSLALKGNSWLQSSNLFSLSVVLQLLLAVGTKLEHIITQLAKEVAEKHTAIEGDLVVQPSDDHFWFGKPRVVLYLIHFILFQNAFEIAFFFWLWVTYGFDSCIMGKVSYVIPRLIFGVIIQVLCSFSTLPLYAIVTQMGSSFKKMIFDEHVQENLAGWAQKARRRKVVGPMSNPATPSTASNTHARNRSPDEIQLQEAPLVHSVPNNNP
ncbi:hypothetical protein EJ110_NYTH13644 [Nymphaea thermarum]|nr:hypothetical protein EJ110_NYTH13644 [Nymphaea thermarum]